MCDLPEKDVNEIIPNLWLGNFKAAYDRQYLKAYNIRYIVSIMDNFDKRYQYDGITYLFIPVTDEDTCNANMNNIFEATTKFILTSLHANQGVLVHCKQGHHRSASIVAAFLFQYLNITYATAINYIRKIRPCALRRPTCIQKKLYEYYVYKKSNIIL